MENACLDQKIYDHFQDELVKIIENIVARNLPDIMVRSFPARHQNMLIDLLLDAEYDGSSRQ